MLKPAFFFYAVPGFLLNADLDTSSNFTLFYEKKEFKYWKEKNNLSGCGIHTSMYSIIRYYNLTSRKRLKFLDINLPIWYRYQLEYWGC